MKKSLFLILLITVLVSSLNAQQSLDFFNRKTTAKITWYGIDYSHVRLVGLFAQLGETGVKTEEMLRDTYFPVWNFFVHKEPKKYSVKRMLHKKQVEIDLTMISEINKQANLEAMRAEELPNYTDEQIQNIVMQYDFGSSSGFAALFIAEYLNKDKGRALYHYVVLNKSTKEIVIHDRIKARAGGMGLRNYWANSIYKAFVKGSSSYSKYRRVLIKK